MIVTPNLFKDLGRILFWYPLRWCIHLTPYPLLAKIGNLLGEIDYQLTRTGRVERVTKTLQSSLDVSHHQALQFVKQNLCNHYCNNLELIKYPGMELQHLKRYVSVEGIEHVQAGVSKGAGVVLMTAHLGAKQLLQIYLGRSGYKVNQVNHHLDAEKLTFVQKNVSQRLRKKIEEELPVTFIPTTGFQRKTLQCLQNNEILIVAGDGSGVKELIDSSYEAYPFLGKTMVFPSGPKAMAKRTGAEVIPVFVLRKGYKHRIIFEPPITDDIAREDSNLLKKYVVSLESKVRTNPQMWDFWEEFGEGVLVADDKCENVN